MKPQNEKALGVSRLGNASYVMAILLMAALALGIMGCSSRSASSGTSSSEAQTTAQGTTTSSVASTATSSTSAMTTKPSKDGFDEATNATETIAGVTFQIPSYFGTKADDNYYAERGSTLAMLNWTEKEANVSSSEFEKGKPIIASSMIESLDKNSTITESKDIVVAGLPGYTLSVKTKINGISVDGTFVFFFNEKDHKIGFFNLGQSENSKYDYSQDFQKIVNSAVVLEEPAPEAQAGGVSPDLKEMLDSYESFIDEYISFMEKYKNSDNTTSLLLDYTNYLQKYSDLTQKMNAVDTSNLSGADYAYYVEVMTRCSTKLMNAAL